MASSSITGPLKSGAVGPPRTEAPLIQDADDLPRKMAHGEAEYDQTSPTLYHTCHSYAGEYMAILTSTENLGKNQYAQTLMNETPVYADFTGNFRDGYGDQFIPVSRIMQGPCGENGSVDQQNCEVFICLVSTIRNYRNKGLSKPYSHDSALKKVANGYIEGGTDFLQLTWNSEVYENLQQWHRQALILLKDYFFLVGDDKGLNVSLQSIMDNNVARKTKLDSPWNVFKSLFQHILPQGVKAEEMMIGDVEPIKPFFGALWTEWCEFGRNYCHGIDPIRGETPIFLQLCEPNHHAYCKVEQKKDEVLGTLVIISNSFLSIGKSRQRRVLKVIVILQTTFGPSLSLL